jgi:hypothetical protein
MDDDFEFIFELVDQITGPTKAMDRALGRVEGAAKAVNEQLKQLDATARKLRIQKGAGLTVDPKELKALNAQRRLLRDVSGAIKGMPAAPAGAPAARSREGNVLDDLSPAAGMFGTALGLASAFAGAVADVATRVVEVGSAAENTQIALAGMLQAGGITGGWDESTRVAATAMARIRADAARLPGSADDFVTVFQLALPKAIEAGMTDPAAISQFTNLFGATAISLNIDARQAGRDLNLLLSGRAGAANRTWGALQSQIGRAARNLGFSAASAKEFNHLRPEQRLAAIRGALQGYTPMVDAFGNTWESISSTFTSTLDDIFRMGSKPLFEGFKRSLDGVNKWITANRAGLDKIVGVVGTELANAFSFVASELAQVDMDALGRSVRPALDIFRAVGAVLKNQVWPILKGLGGGFFSGLLAGLGPLAQAMGLIAGGKTDPAPWQAIGEAVGKVVAGLIGAAAWSVRVGLSIANAFAGAVKMVLWFWSRLRESFGGWADLGRLIVEGLTRGLTEAWPSVLETLRSFTAMLPQVAADELAIQSPSRVFMELGAHTAEGFAVGIEDGAPRARGSMEDLVGAPSAGGGGGGRGALALTVNVYMQGRGSAEDGEEIGEAVGAEVFDVWDLLDAEGT